MSRCSAPVCSQCGRALPAGPDERRRWAHENLLDQGEDDQAVSSMLLCPECRAEGEEHEFEEGAGD
jgi:hypothetical protein